MRASPSWAGRAAEACARAANVPSPCMSVCTMDATTGLCRGCWRTLDEIAAWSTMSDAGKCDVWRRIATRTTAGEAGP